MEKNEPIWHCPKTLNIEPVRANDRKLKLEPVFANSKTETCEPMRQKVRTEIAEASSYCPKEDKLEPKATRLQILNPELNLA
jgi:hypothetical protein